MLDLICFAEILYRVEMLELSVALVDCTEVIKGREELIETLINVYDVRALSVKCVEKV